MEAATRGEGAYDRREIVDAELRRDGPGVVPFDDQAVRVDDIASGRIDDVGKAVVDLAAGHDASGPEHEQAQQNGQRAQHVRTE